MDDYDIVTGGDFSPILRHWDAINFSIIGLTAIAIIVVLFSKDSTQRKIINILAIFLLPLIGALYVFGWQLYKKLKHKNAGQPAWHTLDITYDDRIGQDKQNSR